jgi:hypothetical protein
MSEIGYTPAKTGASRVFLIEGAAGPNHPPVYKPCLRALGASQDFGDVERIQCPSPDRYNEFVEVGQIQGAVERPTSTLQGRYPQDEASDLLRIAKKRCEADVHVHFGECSDPRDFNTFTKAVIYENAILTNFSTDDMGALGSDEQAVINEQSDLSGKEIYEVLPLSFATRCGTQVVAPVVDVVICDSPSCGDCEDESDGCEKIFAVTESSAGSPGTAPDLIWSDDGLQTCHADDITSLLAGETASALACLGVYVVVVSNATNSLHYKTKEDIWNGVVGGWTENATGFVLNAEPRDIWSVGNYAFIVGDGGYVYGTSDPAAGVTVLDAGVATTNQLNAVHAIDDEFAVAVGNSDTIIYTENRTIWQAATATGSGANLLGVWCKSKKEWWVVGATNTVYYTLDGGHTWVQVTLPGTGWTNIYDIAFATNSVGYIAGQTATPRGRLLRTFSGGGGTPPYGGWVILPEGTQVMPLSDAFYAVAACQYDPNFVVGVGLDDGAVDGIVVLGQD